MKVLKMIFVISIFVLLVACIDTQENIQEDNLGSASKNSDSDNITSEVLNENTEVESNQDKVIVQGYSLEELELTFVLEYDKQFADPNSSTYPKSNAFPPFSQWNSREGFVRIWLDPPYRVNGQITTLDINFSDDVISLSSLPVKYFQGFYKSELRKENHYIEIESRLYNINELERFKVFENDTIVVYEITTLLLSVYTMDKKIEVLSAGWAKDHYDYTWLKEVYDFLNSEVLVISDNIATRKNELRIMGYITNLDVDSNAIEFDKGNWSKY
ncbi:MAG: hypothetical protein ACLKAK_08325 [Alkaliphilus sp.]